MRNLTSRPSRQHLARRLFGLAAAALLAGCRSETDNYYPLSPSYVWEYDAQITHETLAYDPRAAKEGYDPNSVRDQTLRVIFEIRHGDFVKLAEYKALPRYLVFGNVRYTTFLSQDAHGVFWVGHQGPEDDLPILMDPEYMFRRPVVAGESWETTQNTMYLRTPIELGCKTQTEAVGETVIVPAGTFRNCIKITARCADKYVKVEGLEGTSIVEVEETAWLAEKIGVVKVKRTESTNRASLGGAQFSAVLTSYYARR